MNETPLEWLWKQLEQRLGPDEVKTLREGYKEQLRAYQKRLKEEEKARQEERKRNPGPRILG